MFIVVRFSAMIRACTALLAVSLALSIMGAVRRDDGEPAAAVSAPAAGPVLVIDPGHGGLDGGAVGAGGTVESTVNLDVALKLEALVRFCGGNAVLTRESEELDYPDESASIAAKKAADQHQRLELINSTPGAVLLSIHQNKYTSPQPRGPQAFFGDEPGSSELAELIQDKMNSALTGGRRVAAPASDDIYLMRSAQCPAVLIECGFLSNPEECALLANGEYRTKISLCLLSAWMESGEVRYGGYA